MSGRAFLFGVVMAFGLTACGDDEVILEGERLDLRADLEAPADATGTVQVSASATAPLNRAAAISLPAARTNANWTHKVGTAANSITHPALGASLNLVWSVDIGTGNARRARLTANPVVQGGQIFTLDANARVTSIGTNGNVLWTRDLTPTGEDSSDASGGGLAVAGRQLFVTTGFGELHALDTTNGATQWLQRLDAAATGAPTVSDGLVVLVDRDNQAWGVDTRNGRVRWQAPGVRSSSGIVGGPSAAIASGRVVLPYSSGQLTAVTTNDGAPIWFTTIAGIRTESAFARILDIAGDPVIVGSAAYIGNSSGRTIAVNVGTGQRLWTVNNGALGPVWVTGGSVFFISDRNELLRLNAASGERIWGIELPFRRPVRRLRKVEDVFVHYGPVLAGGRLLIASDDGLLRSISPTDGRLLSVISLPGPAARPPVVAGRTLYIVTDDGTLHAFR